jgi:glycerate-2-kinase
MAQAIEDVLGELITEGHVNAKKGEERLLNRIGVTFAGHPIPDKDSVNGSEKILNIERKAKKGDIVFFTESGGGTALMTLPGPGISLEDIQLVTRLLYFEHGAPMWDANAVRWQLMILRGRHGRYVGDATLITVHTDERPPGLQVIRRPQRTRTYRDAVTILKKYQIWDEVPESIKKYLKQANPLYDRIQVGELDDKQHYHFRVMGPEYMLHAAKNKANELNMKTSILASSLSDIEAQTAARVLSFIAQEIEAYNRPLTPPSILLCGGEILVTTGKTYGVGGRNQEFALSAATRIEGSENVVIASVDSDGTDGPTDVAGGIVDGYTVERSKCLGINLVTELETHNSSSVLQKLGDTIVTGSHGTNVQDLRVIYVEDCLSQDILRERINRIAYDGMRPQGI